VLVHRVTLYLYIPLEPWRAHINVLNTHACTSVDIRSKQKHGGGSNKVQTIHRTIAPNIRTIHRNSTWLRRKSNYAVPIKHTTLFLFPTNNKFKNPANFSAGSREKILFAKHEPGSNNHPLSCKHLANANVKPMKNTENTMKFPPTKRLRMDIHDLNICYPSCKLIPTHGKPPRQTQHVATKVGASSGTRLAMNYNTWIYHILYVYIYNLELLDDMILSENWAPPN
jgi:hypothetical protein